MNEPGGNAGDLVVDGLQAGKELLGSELAEGIAALELGDVQGHGVLPGVVIRWTGRR